MTKGEPGNIRPFRHVPTTPHHGHDPNVQGTVAFAVPCCWEPSNISLNSCCLQTKAMVLTSSTANNGFQAVGNITTHPATQNSPYAACSVYTAHASATRLLAGK